MNECFEKPETGMNRVNGSIVQSGVQPELIHCIITHEMILKLSVVFFLRISFKPSHAWLPNLFGMLV